MQCTVTRRGNTTAPTYVEQMNETYFHGIGHAVSPHLHRYLNMMAIVAALFEFPMLFIADTEAISRDACSSPAAATPSLPTPIAGYSHAGTRQRSHRGASAMSTDSHAQSAFISEDVRQISLTRRAAKSSDARRRLHSRRQPSR